MSIRTVIKEISLVDYKLELSLAIYCDNYSPTVHPPRIEIVFDNEQDSRRFVLHESAFDPDSSGTKAIAYATYKYAMKNVFWNCVWDSCEMWIDIDYDGTLYHKVPLETEFVDPAQKEKVKFCEDHYELHFDELIDRRKAKIPSLLKCILAILLRLGNAVLGIFLLPWFFLDVCGIMFLGTERKNNKIQGSFPKRFILYMGWRYFGFCRNTRGITGAKKDTLKLAYQFYNGIYRKKSGILFLSCRRNDMTGNFEYVYEHLKDKKDIKISFWLHPEDVKELGIGTLLEMARKAARAKVILVDDFVPYLSIIPVSEETKVMQLWHACGAFKTFGFSRMGKKGGPSQSTVAHRRYDYTCVSSAQIAKYYAEGFGISEKKVLSYGVPRTDIFFNEEYKKNTRERLFAQYPRLKDKKIILFAPTFRGSGKVNAYYEEKRFDPNKVISKLSEEYVLIVKHHPFVSLKYKIKDTYKDRIFDFSEESEINDLLFITDILITDYSSVIYEASLLNIPMLFYAYDLENYIASRDFYSGYREFVPGKIVRKQKQVIEAIRNNDFEQEKVEAFCQKNFDIRDGKASERVASFILELLEK